MTSIAASINKVESIAPVKKYSQSIKHGSPSQLGCKPDTIAGHELQTRANRD
ncbi:hypothetical protein [Pontibacter kalidii]|uniref:hypothetical protein n=1 Tax=Pontibacter kalidii TaxID=2592049 RepID=UPI0022555218|nr:hypothetical protein [Pontibacter kalidii]